MNHAQDGQTWRFSGLVELDWNAEDVMTVAAWLQVCALLIIWLS